MKWQKKSFFFSTSIGPKIQLAVFIFPGVDVCSIKWFSSFCFTLWAFKQIGLAVITFSEMFAMVGTNFRYYVKHKLTEWSAIECKELYPFGLTFKSAILRSNHCWSFIRHLFKDPIINRTEMSPFVLWMKDRCYYHCNLIKNSLQFLINFVVLFLEFWFSICFHFHYETIVIIFATHAICHRSLIWIIHVQERPYSFLVKQFNPLNRTNCPH